MLSKMVMSLLKNSFFLYHIIPVIIISQRIIVIFSMAFLIYYCIGWVIKEEENLYDQDKQFHIYFGHVQLMH